MDVRKRRCRCCRRLFPSHPHTPKQRTCSRRPCQKSRHQKDCVAWRKKNPVYDHRWRSKKRGWAKAYPDYWRHYRAAHPGYAAQERERMRRKRRRARRVANQDAWRTIAVEKLAAIAAKATETVANQDVCDRRVDDMLDFLIWKEGVANRDASPAGVALADNSDHGQSAVGEHPSPL